MGNNVRRFGLWIAAVSLLFVALLAFREWRSSKLIVKPLTAVKSTAYHFTFEIPSLYLHGKPGRILPLVRVIEAKDSYEYEFADGRIKEAQDAEAYSFTSPKNPVKQLQVLKPLSGTWSFRVKRKIKRVLFLRFVALHLPDSDELWVSQVFTNECRPPDVNSLTANSPFE